MKKILLLVLISSSLYSSTYKFSDEQKTKIKDTYNIGKNITMKDGMTVGNTLCGIMGQESTWGINIIGDKYYKNGKLKSLYLSSLGPFQIKLSTAKITIRKFDKLYKKYGNLLYEGDSIYIKYEKNKKKMDYYQSVIDSTTWRERTQNNEPKAIKTMKWALRNLRKHIETHNELKLKASKDTRLINKLLTDHKFGAEIAGHYLKLQYDYVVRKGWSNPYKRAVGRYNGGWNNMNYANKVIKRMKISQQVTK